MKREPRQKDFCGRFIMTDWFDGNNEPLGSISASDRGLQYGDGLFETIAIRNGEPRFLQLHIERLLLGCERLSIRLPDDVDLYGSVMHAVLQNRVMPAYSVAKIIVSAGSTLRGYGRQDASTPTLLFAAFPAAPVAGDRYRDGIDTVLCETRLASHSPLAGLKTLNRLEQVLARSEIVESEVFEGLTMDADDNIICGTMSNLFCVDGEQLITPALTGSGVAGVMRRKLIDTLKEHEIEIIARNVTRDEFNRMDEVFISNSQFGILPVRRCGDATWVVGPVTRQAMALLAENGVAECRL